MFVTFGTFEKKPSRSDQYVAVDVMGKGYHTRTPAEFRLDKNNIRAVTQGIKKSVVHAFAEADPFKVVVDPHRGDDGRINSKAFEK